MKQVVEAIAIDGIIKYIEENSKDVSETGRHGYWIMLDGQHGKCSHCGKEVSLAGYSINARELLIEENPYCRKCGAKMDIQE